MGRQSKGYFRIEDRKQREIGIERIFLFGFVTGDNSSVIHFRTCSRECQYGERVWKITSGTKEERIEETIRRTEEFFRSLGLTTRLHEENIGEETILEIERRFNERGAKYGENENVTGAVARKILETAL